MNERFIFFWAIISSILKQNINERLACPIVQQLPMLVQVELSIDRLQAVGQKHVGEAEYYADTECGDG